MSDDNVLDFRTKKKIPTDRPVQLTMNTATACPHFQVMIDPVRPEIQCASCQLTVDPYWYIRQLAQRFIRIDYRINELKRLEARAEDRRLKAQERRKNRPKKP